MNKKQQSPTVSPRLLLFCVLGDPCVVKRPFDVLQCHRRWLSFAQKRNIMRHRRYHAPQGAITPPVCCEMRFTGRRRRRPLRSLLILSVGRGGACSSRRSGRLRGTRVSRKCDFAYSNTSGAMETQPGLGLGAPFQPQVVMYICPSSSRISGAWAYTLVIGITPSSPSPM